ncbi:MAG: SMP-30/gluconolactonase/LRE family protein [Thermoguttaceae bacterium]|nr:SMP-30/gluconolactonase/LRE family protein [Thermoguttaceae bacterium]
MKKAILFLSALLALVAVSTATFAQDGPRGPRQQGDRPAFERPNLKPTLFANLGDECYTPDGMTVSDETGLLYLNVPNFGRMDDKMVKADSAQGGYLYEVDKDGKATRILEYPVSEKTGQAGPMGLDFGPDGNLYVCDNQYFHNKDFCSRILRVVFKDGKPTQEVQVVIEGVKLANGMSWYQDKLFYTDSCFDIDAEGDEIIGSGGVFMFSADEVTKAGKDGEPAIQIKAGPDDPHCVAYAKVQKLGRGDNTGPDGICVDKNGTVWFGNFGNGYLYCLRPNDAGEYKQENVENVFDALNQRVREQGPNAGVKLECCDGIFYDKDLDCVYIDDSVGNAIWMFKPCEKGQTVRPVIMWTNDDNDGADGSLDQPCEACVYAGKLLLVNFDWPFPGMKNSTVDPPGTISGIDYAEVEKFVRMMERFQGPRGPREGMARPNGERPRDGQARPRGPRDGQARPQGDRPRGERPQGDRPQRRGNRPQGDRPNEG